MQQQHAQPRKRSFCSHSYRQSSHHNRNEQNSRYIGTAIKVNLQKKFPLDFFNGNGIPSVQLRPQIRYKKSRYKTQKKLLPNFINQLVNDRQSLPEAKITSFFNIPMDFDENPVNTQRRSTEIKSERKLRAINMDRIPSNKHQQISSSVQLYKKYDNDMDLCCTFSKVPISRSNFITPVKKNINIKQLRRIQPNTQDNQCERTFSARDTRKLLSRNSGIENNSIFKGRRDNGRKKSSNKWVGNSKNIVWMKLGKGRLSQQIELSENELNCQ